MTDKRFFLREFFGHDKFSITPLLGDASSRQYFRISYQQRHFILCHDVDQDCFNRFVESAKWFALQGIAVPEIIKIDQKSMLVLQSDLGDCSLSIYREQQNRSKDQLESAVKLMQQIHHTKVEENIFLFKWQFDLPKLLDEFAMMQTYFWKGYLKQLWIDEYSEVIKRIHNFFLDIPYVLVHRDFHARNIHVWKTKLYMIDFQDARLGPLTYDLVSYVEDPYSPLSEQEKVMAKEYFISNWPTDISQEQFLFWYDIVAVQRLFKILGSFTYLFAKKGKDRYLQYIPRTIDNLVHALHRLEDRVEGIDSLIAILERDKR